jgi:hypothetical protein
MDTEYRVIVKLPALKDAPDNVIKEVAGGRAFLYPPENHHLALPDRDQHKCRIRHIGHEGRP